MKLAKTLNIVLWGFLAVTAFLIISLLSNLSDNSADSVMGAWIETNLVWCYILFGISIASVLILGLYNTLNDPQALKRGLLALGFMVVVLGISYALADSAIPQFYGVEKFVADGTLTATVSKWIGTGLNATYILFGLSIISIIYSSVSNILK